MRTTTVVIGAGHSGLAMSKCLSDRSIDHVVLERRQVANSWRTERWDSLRLLTPNWQCRLPGHSYEGSDPNGFMTMAEVVDFITDYAKLIDAPVQTDSTVSSVRRTDGQYRVTTSQEEWLCETVVVATGAFNVPHQPPLSDAVPSSVTTLTPFEYKNPDLLAEGGVLVVGASATGVQIACEVQRSGRQVTLAVGEHVRGPRDYRGRDIHWWMDASGVLDERYDEVDDIVRARRVPSMQLAGSPERANFDLNALTNAGVKLVGRLAGISEGQAQFSGSLRNKCELADLKLGRLLDTIDEWASASGLDDRCRPLTGSHRLWSATHRRSVLIWRAVRSRPSSGRRDSVRTTRGSTSRSSMARGCFATMEASSIRPACSCWAARFCADVNQASWTVPGRTLKSSIAELAAYLDAGASLTRG